MHAYAKRGCDSRLSNWGWRQRPHCHWPRMWWCTNSPARYDSDTRAHIHACIYAYVYLHSCMHACVHVHLTHQLSVPPGATPRSALLIVECVHVSSAGTLLHRAHCKKDFAHIHPAYFAGEIAGRTGLMPRGSVHQLAHRVRCSRSFFAVQEVCAFEIWPGFVFVRFHLNKINALYWISADSVVSDVSQLSGLKRGLQRLLSLETYRRSVYLPSLLNAVTPRLIQVSPISCGQSGMGHYAGGCDSPPKQHAPSTSLQRPAIRHCIRYDCHWTLQMQK